MAKRKKRPAVSPDLRRQWFRRFEEYGESPPKIARLDGYDVRTVRKQIELGRQEREAREARSMVLRQALEKHYADLTAFAEELDHALLTPSVIPLSQRLSRMWPALREHLPRSPIWKKLDRWEQLHSEISTLMKQAGVRLRREVESKGVFGFAEHPHEVGLHPGGFGDAATSRLKAIAETGDKAVPLERFISQQTEGGLVQVAYGNRACATVRPEQEAQVRSLIADILAQVGQWPECESMEKVLSELKKVVENLGDELATISLRRVVPGRCRYCPI